METVTHVNPRDDFHLELEFNTGEARVFDVRPYLDKGVFKQLRDISRFKQAHVAYDTVCWPGELDIAPETLYDKSVPVSVKRGKNNGDFRKSDASSIIGV